MNISTKETISLPKKSVERLFDAMHFYDLAQNEIEDFLIGSNKAMMAKIKKARTEHVSGNTKDFRNLLKKYA